LEAAHTSLNLARAAWRITAFSLLMKRQNVQSEYWILSANPLNQELSRLRAALATLHFLRIFSWFSPLILVHVANSSGKVGPARVLHSKFVAT
jgi:hypothetical protein